jgi:hypothetical protein
VVTSTNFTIKAAYADGFSTTKSFDLTTICGYQLAPVTATNVAAGYGSGGFTVLTCSGCFWSALASTNWIQTSSIGWGTNSVSFTADANPTTNARSATIQVRDQNFTVTQAKATPYQAWRFGYFTSNELADVTISGDGAAPAGDGVPNLMKYAFALNPKVAASANSLPILGVADGCLSLTYRLNSQAPDLTNIVQVCTDLVSGVWTTTNFPVLSTVTNGSFWLITVRDLVPMSNAASRFLRLKITGP